MSVIVGFVMLLASLLAVFVQSSTTSRKGKKHAMGIIFSLADLKYQERRFGVHAHIVFGGFYALSCSLAREKGVVLYN